MLIKLNGVIADGTSPVTATAATQPLAFAQGQDVTIQVTVTGSNDSVINVTNYSASLTIKNAPGTAPAFSLVLPGVLTTPLAGVISFSLSSAQSLTMATLGSFVFDVFVTSGSNARDEVVPNSKLQLIAAVGA